MIINVIVPKNLTIKKANELLQEHGMLDGVYEDVSNNYMEIIHISDIDQVSAKTKEKILKYAQDEFTTYSEMEQKYFFFIEEPGKASFSFGPYISFYEKEAIIGEVDADESDQAYQDWVKRVREFCFQVGWEIV